IRWFNTELNGAPLEMTDAEGSVRWSGDYGSFGAVTGQTQDSEGLRHGKPVESQSLRYAGQYADEETGLHYNLFRYYDPTVGRFTTQDPIGLAGGLNLYQYAPNPLGWVDPLGLAKCGSGEWKSRRTFKNGDSGLKDHARRHSNLSPEKYLERGKRNISDGSLLKGGGKHPDTKYYIRKLGDNDYSVTIADRNNKILSIDTWKKGGTPMTQDDIIKNLNNNGIAPPNGFWEAL
ncbi:RHS repeat-associated core domain-containing protein, partial [Pectobacterium wasabiae]